MRRYATGARVRDCGRRRIGGAVFISAASEGGCHYDGLLRCGRSWVCPVCAMVVAARRADEMTGAVEHWGQQRCALLTLTMRHQQTDAMAELVVGLGNAYRRLARGAPWERLKQRWGITHTVRKAEDTHGDQHGWHPHLHIVLFLGRELSPAALEQAQSEIAARWQKMVLRELGVARLPTQYAGCDLRPLKRSDYLAKFGLEVAGALTKRGRGGNRTPWQIAADLVEHGRRSDELLWREYQLATFGRRSLTWSDGARAALGLDVEKTDQEIVDAEDRAGGDVVLSPDLSAVWNQVRRVKGLPLRLLERGEAALAHGVDAAISAILDELARAGIVIRGPPFVRELGVAA